jgi:creatinine amidohydrolase
MIEWKHLTCDEVAQLDRNLPVVIPIGLIEAHGPHLALSVDCDTAEYFARRVAENTGAILAPLMPYGYADEMAEYPGTLGVTADTLVAVYADLARHFCSHGFLRQIWLSGHGANKAPFDLALPRIWQSYPNARLAYWNYWAEAGFTKIAHADQGETEIALAVGTHSHMDRVRDYKVVKPWYRLRSRQAIHPETGGINGEPSKATRDAGLRVCDDIVRILAEKVLALCAFERPVL